MIEGFELSVLLAKQAEVRKDWKTAAFYWNRLDGQIPARPDTKKIKEVVKPRQTTCQILQKLTK